MTNEINGLPRPRPAAADETKGAKAPAPGARAPVVPASETGNAAPVSSDTLKLTEAAARLQRLEAALSDLPDIDQRRVEALRREIQSGAYRTEPERVAQKLVALERMLGQK